MVATTTRCCFFWQVCYPKPTDKPLYTGLVTQCRSLGIPFLSLEDIQSSCQPGSSSSSSSTGQQQSAAGLHAVCDVIIDALFGFSFKGSPRPPFNTLLEVGWGRGEYLCAGCVAGVCLWK